MKFGLDIHGVITKNPKFFSEFSHFMVASGHEVHIVTGASFAKVKGTLKRHKIAYTHFYSIFEDEKKRGVAKIEVDKKGNPHMDPKVWNTAKARYCKKHGIDLHLDDTLNYGDFFSTPFAFYRYTPTK